LGLSQIYDFLPKILVGMHHLRHHLVQLDLSGLHFLLQLLDIITQVGYYVLLVFTIVECTNDVFDLLVTDK
jgi:aminoglycoside N3'-acetyltransferase